MAQTYKYTIVGDTKPAVAGNEALDVSINKVDASTNKLKADTEQLSKEQRKQAEEANKAFSQQLENKIKTTDSLIKGLGGTVSLLTGTLSTVVGTLGLFGIDDEQIQGFQKAALSVLALSSGITQQITGLKDVTEAQKLQNEVTQSNLELTKASTTAENINTAALNTNKDAVKGVTAAFQQSALSIRVENTEVAGNTALRGANAASTGASTGSTIANTVATYLNVAAQKALNVAIKANPYLALASILVSVTTLIYGVTKALFFNTKAEEDNTEAKELNERAIKAQKDATDALTKARGLSDVQLAKQQVLEAKGAKAQAERQFILAQSEGKFSQKREEARIALIEATTALTNAETNLSKAEEEARKKAKDDAKIAADKAKALRDERFEREGILQLIELERQALFDELFPEFKEKSKDTILDPQYLLTIDEALKSINTTIQEIDLGELDEPIKFLSQEQLDILKRLRGELNSELKRQLFDREKQYNDELALFANNEEAKTRLTEEYEKDRIRIRRQYALQLAAEVLSTTNALLSQLGTLQQEAIDIELGKLERKYQRDLQLAGENEKLKEQITRGFEARELEIQKKALEQQKNLRRAQVVTTTAESIINAFNSTSTLPPPFNFIAGGILAAAYTALGAKAIANINATTLEGGDTPGGFSNIPGGGGFSLPGGTGVPTGLPTGGPLPGLGGGRTTTPTIGTVAEGPIRAYVLAGDVENGVQANIALNNRRRLAG